MCNKFLFIEYLFYYSNKDFFKLDFSRAMILKISGSKSSIHVGITDRKQDHMFFII